MNAELKNKQKVEKTATERTLNVLGNCFLKHWSKKNSNTTFHRTANECIRKRKTWRRKSFLQGILLPLVILALVAMILPQPMKIVKIAQIISPAWVGFFFWNRWRLHPGDVIITVAKEWSAVLKKAEATGLFEEMRRRVLTTVKNGENPFGQRDYKPILEGSVNDRLLSLAGESKGFEHDGAERLKKKPRQMFDKVYELSKEDFGYQPPEVGYLFGKATVLVVW